MNRLGITICATKSYAYAVNVQAIAIQSAIFEYIRVRKTKLRVDIILVSDGCQKMHELGILYHKLLKNDFVDLKIHNIAFNSINDDNKGYKEEAQKIIARLRTAAFNLAKTLNLDYCWSLDSDVIPKANSLLSMEDILLFDDGYYSVACCPYPSQGGGSFLCGRGSFRNPILKDIYPDEKEIPKKISKRINFLNKEREKIISNLKNKKINQDLLQRLNLLNKKIHYWDKYLEKKVRGIGNVFSLNSKQWRKRGWFDFAYPAIGKGAVVPTDWCGFGCNLINKKALNLIDFHGYDGKGTEDLFIVWYRWFVNGIKMVAIPHCPADHIIRERTSKNMKPSEFKKYSHVFTFHEVDGEFEGHLRQQKREFIDFSS